MSFLNIDLFDVMQLALSFFQFDWCHPPIYNIYDNYIFMCFFKFCFDNEELTKLDQKMQCKFRPFFEPNLGNFNCTKLNYTHYQCFKLITYKTKSITEMCTFMVTKRVQCNMRNVQRTDWSILLNKYLYITTYNK